MDQDQTAQQASRQREVRIVEATVAELSGLADPCVQVFDGQRTGVVLRGAVDAATVAALVERIAAGDDDPAWERPNQGMPGGDLRVIGTAATPTFSFPTGPPTERYVQDAEGHEARRERLFGAGLDPFEPIRAALQSLVLGRPVLRPTGASGQPWPPYTLRSLESDQQIYPHHDAHYRLAVFEDLDPAVDRSTLLSYFLTLASPEAGGELLVYGLQSADPDPPVLPTRFLDTEALDRHWQRAELSLAPGDLVVFDSGRHVHRVTPVTGPRSRLTIGGFLAFDAERSRLFCWS